MKGPKSGSVLVVGFVLVAIGAIALNLYVNGGEGSLRPDNDPKLKKASPIPPATEEAPSTSSEAPAPRPDVVAIGVVLADGVPFEGAQVRAADSMTRAARQGVMPNSEVAITGKDGRFVLGKLPPAPFLLRADAPGWSPAWAEVDSVGTAARIEGFVLDLEPAGAIRGRVTSVDGKPVAGARMVAGGERGNGVGRFLAEVMTGEDGTFLLDPVRPGAITVAALHPGVGYGAAVVDVRRGSEARADLVLVALGRVRGRVTDPRGNPLARARATVIAPMDLDLLPSIAGASVRALTVVGRVQTVESDADGRFELRALLSRATSITVREDSHRLQHRKFEVGANGEAPDLEIVLQPTDDSR